MVKHHVSYCDLFDGYVDRDPTPSAIPIKLLEKVLKVKLESKIEVLKAKFEDHSMEYV